MKKIFYVITSIFMLLSISSCFVVCGPIPRPYTIDELANYEYEYGKPPYVHYSYIKRYIEDARKIENWTSNYLAFDGYDVFMLIYNDFLKDIEKEAYLYRENHFEGFYRCYSNSEFEYRMSTETQYVYFYYYSKFQNSLSDFNELNFSFDIYQEYCYNCYSLDFDYSKDDYIHIGFYISPKFGFTVDDIKYDEYIGIEAVREYVLTKLEII